MEEGEIGLDAQTHLTKMDGNCNMHDGIWIELVDLKTIEIKEATKEVPVGVFTRIKLAERRMPFQQHPFPREDPLLQEA